MSNAKEIRSKIRSIRNTQKITRAMEMVAASKMRRAKERMEQARPYAEKILQVIGHLAHAHPEYHHPFLEIREKTRAGYIVITTDRGLCGGLNTLLLRGTIAAIRKEMHAENTSLALIGRKADAFFRRIGGQILGRADRLGDAPVVTDITGIVKVMLDAWKSSDPKERIDALYLCSNTFINTMKQEPTIQQILPVQPSAGEDVHKHEKYADLLHHWDYLYEPDNARVILDRFMTRYIESQVYRALIENIACEQAARMVAMKSATDNAADLINDLDTAYNKARQAGITRELTEIVAGAAEV